MKYNCTPARIPKTNKKTRQKKRKTSQTIPSVGEDVEQLELLYYNSGSVK